MTATARAGTRGVFNPLKRIGDRPPPKAWCPLASTAAASGSYAFNRASANTPSLKASAAGSSGRRLSSGSRAAAAGTCVATSLPIAAPDGVSPINPSASAARPATTGDGSLRAARRGSMAVASPINPSANAPSAGPRCRVGLHQSDEARETPSVSPTRPTQSPLVV